LRNEAPRERIERDRLTVACGTPCELQKLPGDLRPIHGRAHDPIQIIALVAGEWVFADQIGESENDLEPVVEHVRHAACHLPGVHTGIEQSFGDQLLMKPAFRGSLLSHVMQHEQHRRRLALEIELSVHIHIVDGPVDPVESFAREQTGIVTRCARHQLALHTFEMRMIEERCHRFANDLCVANGPRQPEHGGIRCNDAFTVVHHDAVWRLLEKLRRPCDHHEPVREDLVGMPVTIASYSPIVAPRVTPFSVVSYRWKERL